MGLPPFLRLLTFMYPAFFKASPIRLAFSTSMDRTSKGRNLLMPVGSVRKSLPFTDATKLAKWGYSSTYLSYGIRYLTIGQVMRFFSSFSSRLLRALSWSSIFTIILTDISECVLLLWIYLARIAVTVQFGWTK